MSDPLSDPRAHALLTADPGEVEALASQFRRVASQAETAISGLHGAHGDATWTGGAADNFRKQLGKLPGDLDKVQHSYSQAAGALTTYSGELGPLRSKFQSLATQLRSAQSSLTTAQGTLNSATGDLTTATQAPHAKSTTPAVVNAHTAVNDASGAVARAQGELSGLDRQAYQVLDEFDTVRGHARSAVSSAAGVAPQQGGWFSSMMHSIGNFVSGAGHVLAGIGKGVWHAAKSLPGDVWTVMEHPTDLHDWAKLGEDAGTVAGAVAAVCVIVACPADALGFEAVAGAAEATEGVAGTAATYAATTKTGADTVEAIEGKGSWGEVGFDLAGNAVGKLDLPAFSSAEGRVGMLETKAGALEQYGDVRALGFSHSTALATLSEEQSRLITHSAARLSSPARLSYMRSVNEAQLAAAKTVKYRAALPNEAAHQVVDHSLDAIKHKVLPDGSDGGDKKD